MKNWLIVESKNDRYFIEALIRAINASIDRVEAVSIEKYEPLDGLDPQKLTGKFKQLKSEAEKGSVDRIGIILDLDQKGEVARLALINNCLSQTFESKYSLTKTSEFISVDWENSQSPLQIACYFTGVDDQGELETLLRTISNKPSPYADCLAAWQRCLEQKGHQPVSPKEFDKFWVAQYLRWDTCTSEERKQAGRKCSMAGLEYVMENKPQIWNWNHAALAGLKDFLQLFSGTTEAEQNPDRTEIG